MGEVKLTEDQRAILSYMGGPTVKFGDPYVCASWIAESCGHYYDTPWASAKLPALVKRGLVVRGQRGWYAITPAGRAALQPQEKA